MLFELFESAESAETNATFHQPALWDWTWHRESISDFIGIDIAFYG
jgi:hypothetical protein